MNIMIFLSVALTQNAALIFIYRAEPSRESTSVSLLKRHGQDIVSNALLKAAADEIAMITHPLLTNCFFRYNTLFGTGEA